MTRLKPIILIALTLFSTQQSFAQRDLIPYRVGSLWGISDLHKNIVLTPAYDKIGLYELNTQSFEVFANGKKGLYFKNGHFIEPIYDKARPLNVEKGNYLIFLEKDNWKTVLINEKVWKDSIQSIKVNYEDAIYNYNVQFIENGTIHSGIYRLNENSKTLVPYIETNHYYFEIDEFGFLIFYKTKENFEKKFHGKDARYFQIINYRFPPKEFTQKEYVAYVRKTRDALEREVNDAYSEEVVDFEMGEAASPRNEIMKEAPMPPPKADKDYKTISVAFHTEKNDSVLIAKYGERYGYKSWKKIYAEKNVQYQLEKYKLKKGNNHYSTEDRVKGDSMLYTPFRNYAIGIKKNKKSIITHRVQTPYIYNSVQGYLNYGLYLFITQSGNVKKPKYGAIYSDGTMLIKPSKKMKIVDFDSDLDFFTVSKDGKFGLINLQNESILDIEYDSIERKMFNRNYILQKDGKYGLYMASGYKIGGSEPILMPAIFEGIPTNTVTRKFDISRDNCIYSIELNGKLIGYANVDGTKYYED